MTPEQITSLAALNQALEERDAEFERIKAELAAVTAWAQRAYKVIRFTAGVFGWNVGNLLHDAPATVRGEAGERGAGA